MIQTAHTAGSGATASLAHATLSDVGLRRANNQDSFAVAVAGDDADWHRRGHLLMVADGMGAHAAGELASKMACEYVTHTYRKSLDLSPAEALRQALLTANTSIHERGQANAEFQGMGTTCSVLVLMPTEAIVGHVGDSRVYRWRAQKLEQLTFDHSLVWEVLAQGQMPSGAVANIIPKNIITRSLGPHAEVKVDLEGPFPLEVGDRFLLCSDGLSGQVKDEEIGVILGALPPDEAARLLIDLANLRGGPDNITAVVAQVLSVPARESDEAEPPPAAQAGPAVHPLLWGVMAVCVLLTLGLAATDHFLPAAACGLLAAATVVGALVQSLMHGPQPATKLNGPLGTGPHAERQCAPDAESVAVLAQTAQQLRDAAQDKHWTLDWSRFNGFCDQAQREVAAGDFARSVTHYARAIIFMMSEIRQNSAHKDHGDSSVLDV